MTIAISPATRAYDDQPVEVLPCTECLDLVEVDDLRDCGTHQLCPGCLASSPCSACKELHRAELFDLAEDAAYDAWRDDQTREDNR